MARLLRLRFVLALVAVVIGGATFLIVRHVEHADSVASEEAAARAEKLELEQIDAQAMRKIRLPADFVASTDRCNYPCWVVHRSSANVARQVLSIFRSAGGVPAGGGLALSGCRTFHKSAGSYTFCNYFGSIDGNTAWILLIPLPTCVGHRCRFDRESQITLTLPGQT